MYTESNKERVVEWIIQFIFIIYRSEFRLSVARKIDLKIRLQTGT